MATILNNGDTPGGPLDYGETQWIVACELTISAIFQDATNPVLDLWSVCLTNDLITCCVFAACSPDHPLSLHFLKYCDHGCITESLIWRVSVTKIIYS